VLRKDGVFALDDKAGGGPVPIDRGLVGANGSSKIVSVCARRVFIVGRGESTHCQLCLRGDYADQFRRRSG
jgi:hypothetical protein